MAYLHSFLKAKLEFQGLFSSEIHGLFVNVESKKKKKKVYWSGRETEKRELW